MRRIAVRLLAFNLLLVFFPVAGVLYLGTYEARLESAEARSIAQQARLLATVLSRDGELDPIAIDELLHRLRGSVRFRVVDERGSLVADSRVQIIARRRGSARRNTLYRIGAFLVRPVVHFLRPPEEPLDVDAYENATRLNGDEVRAALRGREGRDKKISAGQRSVTLYRAVPIAGRNGIRGAVVASASTYPILQDLYVVRLRVLRIFLVSIVVAVLISIFFGTTIVRPLRQLRIDARAVLDRRGRIRAKFKGSRRHDEIGELSRALERIMRRLDSHVQAMETFASDVSHEFKNPLASIRTANEMLAEVNDPANRQRFARMIDQDVARMEKMLSGVREISLIDAQLGAEARGRVALAELLAKIVDGFRMREGERVQFVVETRPGALAVDASEDRLIQVFENLLDNASSFSPPGGTVHIAIEERGRAVVTRIADEGPGIPEQHLRRVFDRFFTYRPFAKSGRLPGAGHTGLGLAIARAIVDGYGGTIRVTNGTRGALFEVRLPAARDVAANESKH
jgi:two-component system sensor histidine kinase ChvG